MFPAAPVHAAAGRRALLAALLVALVPLAGAEQASAGARNAILVKDAATVQVLRRLLDGARERLGEPACQGVLDDFADGAGKPLRESLASQGVDLAGYLGWLVFADGTQRQLCRKPDVVAVATPGSRVVWICPGRLVAKAREAPLLLEAVVIHEMLHTLGLGENPPDSHEITRRVRRRCQ